MHTLESITPITATNASAHHNITTHRGLGSWENVRRETELGSSERNRGWPGRSSSGGGVVGLEELGAVDLPGAGGVGRERTRSVRTRGRAEEDGGGG
jgi:hypothetical protein